MTFPGGERTTYTAAAMVLAADALSSTTPAAGLFRGECLPRRLDLAEPHCIGDAAEGCTVLEFSERRLATEPVGLTASGDAARSVCRHALAVGAPASSRAGACRFVFFTRERRLGSSPAWRRRNK